MNVRFRTSAQVPAIAGLILVELVFAGKGAAAVYRVGPGRLFPTLQTVSPLLGAGDTALVDGDHTYPAGVVFRNPGDAVNRIVIRGERVNGKRPVISGSGMTADGVRFQTNDPFSVPGADHYTFEGFEVESTTNRGIFHQAQDLILRDVVVHDCLNGIVGADQGSGSCLLEYSEIYACGSLDNRHQIYMATDEVNHPGSVFRMQFCFIHDGKGGNNVKSRAERNEIYYNWIEGAFYHELELIGPVALADGGNPNLKREDSDVVGNVLWKKTKPGGAQFYYVTRIGGDDSGESGGRYRFAHNTFLCGANAVFRIFDLVESVEMHNNVFYRIDGTGVVIKRTVEAVWTTGAEVIAGENNWIPTGSTVVPVPWTGTIIGSDPGFVDLAASNMHPTDSSPLLNAGTLSPTSPPGFPFPLPLFPPAFCPPPETLLTAGTLTPRTNDHAPDIGAYEFNCCVDVPPLRRVAGLRLEQNYPNPFRAQTAIRFSLASSGPVSVRVYDVSGRQVGTVVEGTLQPGDYAIPWQAGGLQSGVYYYRIQTRESAAALRRMVVAR